MTGACAGAAGVTDTLTGSSMPVFMDVGLCLTPAVGAGHYTEGRPTRMLPAEGARRRKGMAMKVLMSVLLAACLTGCLGIGGNIPHEDSEGATPHNEGAPLCHDGTPPPCVIRN
jgi:hypothetical protein